MFYSNSRLIITAPIDATPSEKRWEYNSVAEILARKLALEYDFGKMEKEAICSFESKFVQNPT